MNTKIIFMLLAATLFLKGDSHSAASSEDEEVPYSWCGCFSRLFGWGSARVAPEGSSEPDPESGLPTSTDEIREPEGAGAPRAEAIPPRVIQDDPIPGTHPLRDVESGLRQRLRRNALVPGTFPLHDAESARDFMEEFCTGDKPSQITEDGIEKRKNELFEHLPCEYEILQTSYKYLAEKIETEMIREEFYPWVDPELFMLEKWKISLSVLCGIVTNLTGFQTITQNYFSCFGLEETFCSSTLYDFSLAFIVAYGGLAILEYGTKNLYANFYRLTTSGKPETSCARKVIDEGVKKHQKAQSKLCALLSISGNVNTIRDTMGAHSELDKIILRARALIRSTIIDEDNQLKEGAKKDQNKSYGYAQYFFKHFTRI
jgi:hypothetical protein